MARSADYEFIDLNKAKRPDLFGKMINSAPIIGTIQSAIKKIDDLAKVDALVKPQPQVSAMGMFSKPEKEAKHDVADQSSVTNEPPSITRK